MNVTCNLTVKFRRLCTVEKATGSNEKQGKKCSQSILALCYQGSNL